MSRERPRRTGSTWTRSDSLVVLASYFERPRDAMIPPMAERERVANVLRRTVPAVTHRYWMFAAVDPDNASAGEAPGLRERRLWTQYADDRVACLVDAEGVTDDQKRVPRYLS